MSSFCTQIELNIAQPMVGRVVVVGGGFAGIATVKALRKSGFQIVMFDRNNYHQFQPLLYQIATSGLEPTAITFPLRHLFCDYENFYFRMAQVIEVDRENNRLKTSIGEITYDYLILAAGTDTNYFGIKNIEQSALSLKNVGEALMLRNRVYQAMEQALRVSDQQQEYLNFVIVGAGPTGVELCGALAELKNYILPKDYPEIDFAAMNIYLLNAADRILETFSEEGSTRAYNDLRSMGVDIVLSAKVSDYIDNKVIYNGDQSISTRNLVWSSGVIANKIEGISELGRGARILVDEQNKIQGCTNIYAIGDQALMITEQYPAGHPQVAQVAIQQGRNLGYNISKGQQRPFTYNDKGSMATIGRNRAVAEIGRYKFQGFTAWVMWLMVHLLFIIGVRNRLAVMWDWAWSYMTRDQPLRSIIEVKKRPEPETK